MHGLPEVGMAPGTVGYVCSGSGTPSAYPPATTWRVAGTSSLSQPSSRPLAWTRTTPINPVKPDSCNGVLTSTRFCQKSQVRILHCDGRTVAKELDLEADQVVAAKQEGYVAKGGRREFPAPSSRDERQATSVAVLTVFDRNAKYGDVPSVLDPDKQLDGVNEVSQPPVGKLHRSLIPRQRSEGLSIVIFVKPCRYSLCDPPLNLADTGIGLQITWNLTRAVWFLTWARKDPRREHTAITGMHRLWQLLKLEETGVAIDSIGCRKDIARENLEWELCYTLAPMENRVQCVRMCGTCLPERSSTIT